MTVIEAKSENIGLELERRAHARDLSGSLRLFTQEAWHIIEPGYKYKHNFHIDAISEGLEACAKRDIRRLLINIPPRHMKSLSVTVLWPAWWWTFDPMIRFLTASYGDKLALRDARKSRKVLQSEWYQALWPLVFSSDQNTQGRYENAATGYRIATSVGGVATGEGGDVIIIDDPHKTDEIESDVERQKVLDWHDGTISTRFNEPERGVEVIVMQRLHEKDLAGHVLEQGGWEHICLPAEYDPKHPFIWPDDPRAAPGELLWPDRFTREAIDELKHKLGSYQTAGQLQQIPTAREGDLLKRAHWRYFSPKLLDEPKRLPAFRLVVASWDTAFKEKTDSDFVVGTIWGSNLADRYLLRKVRERMSFGATKRAMKEVRQWMQDTWPNARIVVLIEKSANGVDIIAELKREITGVIPVVADRDKRVRAQAAEPTLEGGNCFVPGAADADLSGPDLARTPAWVQEFIEELAKFDKGEYDDQVDSWSQAMNWLNSQSPSPAVLALPDERI